MRRVVWCVLALVPLSGCTGATSAIPLLNPDHAPDLAAKGGTWQSRSKKIITEWTFRPDGTYGALHQEGNVAAQIRGTYKLQNGTLILTPNAVDARSRLPKDAKAVEARLKPGARWETNWSGGDKFTVAPQSSDPIEFDRV